MFLRARVKLEDIVYRGKGNCTAREGEGEGKVECGVAQVHSTEGCWGRNTDKDDHEGSSMSYCEL